VGPFGERTSRGPPLRRSGPRGACGLDSRHEGEQIRGNPDLDDTIARLLAYEAAGADVLYAPGLRDAAEIAAVCEAVTAMRRSGDLSRLQGMKYVVEWLR
jgi:Phosphoenolpyruvate phosphomutase